MSEALDKVALMERVDGDTEFLAETVEILKEDCPELIGQMQQAVTDSNAELLTTAAHTFKGMVANFCAQPAADAALRLEMLGKNGNLTDAGEALRTLEKEARRLTLALENVLAGE